MFKIVTKSHVKHSFTFSSKIVHGVYLLSIATNIHEVHVGVAYVMLAMLVVGEILHVEAEV